MLVNIENKLAQPIQIEWLTPAYQSNQYIVNLFFSHKKSFDMQTMKSFLKGSLMLLAVFTLFARCSDDEGSTSDVTGTVNFELTDGPIDDANIEGVFITVIGVEVDGEPVDSFTKQTINLMDYQGGTTKLLGSFQVEAG